MRSILFTGHDASYKPLADITVPRMAEYAERHGFDFKCHTEPLIDVPNGIYWTGVCGALKAFEEGYDKAIYLDVDQLVTNYDFKLPDWQHGFHASRDWGNDATAPWHFSMCGFLAFNSMQGMFEHALSIEPEWRDKPFPEQGTVQYIVSGYLEDEPRLMRDAPEYIKRLRANLNYKTAFNIHPRKVFNNVPDQICPGNVPEPWQPGSWCAHLTMVDLNRRIEIAKEILNLL